MLVFMRMRELTFMVAVLLAVVAEGCARSPTTPTGPSGDLNESFTLSLGQTVRLSEARFSLTFDAVSSDSRCPGDAICITGGDAVVEITVAPWVGSAVHDQLHSDGVGQVRHGSYTISLEQLMPYPFSSRPFDPASYQATLRVTQTP